MIMIGSVVGVVSTIETVFLFHLFFLAIVLLYHLRRCTMKARGQRLARDVQADGS